MRKRSRRKAKTTPAPHSVSRTIASSLLQIYRLGVLLAIAWLIRDHHLRLRVQGDRPITVAEVRAILPDARRLRADPSPRAGLAVFDKSGKPIGYTVRTMPQTRGITGYSGPLDALIVFDANEKAAGVSIRHSYDTPSHVADVSRDLYFMENWNGRTWDEIAAIDDFGAAGIFAVSGASRTSECLMESIHHRLAVSVGEAREPGNPIRFRWRDAALLALLAGGMLLAFVKKPAVQRWRPAFSVSIFVVLGFVLGDLIAQSLLIGWAESAAPWRQTPGLVLFTAAAFLVPWTTRQPIYCTWLCPHGHAQRWVMKILPARWKPRLPDDVKWPAKAIPVLLLAVVLLTTFFQLPLDLAGIEPFDAYLLQSAGTATVTVAALGLALSLFIPMAYCRFGCPTGALLEFIRRRSGRNRPEARDLLGLVFLLAAIALRMWYEPIFRWIVG